MPRRLITAAAVITDFRFSCLFDVIDDATPYAAMIFCMFHLLRDAVFSLLLFH